jgi:hypothetical protein
MTKKKVARKTARKATSKKKAAVKKAAATSRPASARARAVTALPLMAPLKGVERREIGHVLLEVARDPPA